MPQVLAADEEAMGEDCVAPPHGVPAPIGHVSVCGVELRMRACLSEQGRQSPVVVKTSTVEQNLKSLALALCGVRLRVQRAAPVHALSAASAPAPLDSKTHTGTLWRQDNSRYPYEGARGGSGASSCCCTDSLALPSADSACAAGGSVRFRQEPPPAAPCNLHRRVAPASRFAHIWQRFSHACTTHTHCVDDIRFTVNPLSAI